MKLSLEIQDIFNGSNDTLECISNWKLISLNQIGVFINIL